MQTPTQAAIRTRLEAMLAEIDEIALVITTEDDTLTAEQLPAARVYAGRAERSRELGRQNRMVTRDWYITLLITRIGSADGSQWTAAEKRAAELAAEAYLELIPDHFARYANLMPVASKRQMTGVKRVDEPRDNGLQTIIFGKHNTIYFGAVYELPITILRA